MVAVLPNLLRWVMVDAAHSIDNTTVSGLWCHACTESELYRRAMMTTGRPIRLGIMGFGQTGRQIYELASRSANVEVVANADVGKPEAPPKLEGRNLNLILVPK